jgi:hypothetical protein
MFTTASRTPSPFSNRRCTRVAHAAHVIPSTGIVILSTPEPEPAPAPESRSRTVRSPAIVVIRIPFA